MLYYLYKFVSKGIPVIMGDFGAAGKDNESTRAAWAQYYVNYAGTKDVKCFYWDEGGMFELLNRKNNQWKFPQIITGLMEGANSN